MANIERERVLHTHHWNEKLFSFTTTRAAGFRFQNGHFVTLGLEVENRFLMRAYSVVSANHEDHLEFLSIKVPNGLLTSRLQHLKVGDTVLISRKPTGSLVISDLLPGRRLYLFATGTGLAPFMSIIRDPETYDCFEKVILVHGVRYVSELAYHDFVKQHLPQHEYLGEQVRESLIYYPTVTRESFQQQGRITDLISSGKLSTDIGLPPLDPSCDRAMICGSPGMIQDTCAMLDQRGFQMSTGIGRPGDYVIERAFAEK